MFKSSHQLFLAILVFSYCARLYCADQMAVRNQHSGDISRQQVDDLRGKMDEENIKELEAVLDERPIINSEDNEGIDTLYETRDSTKPIISQRRGKINLKPFKVTIEERSGVSDENINENDVNRNGEKLNQTEVNGALNSRTGSNNVTKTDKTNEPEQAIPIVTKLLNFVHIEPNNEHIPRETNEGSESTENGAKESLENRDEKLDLPRGEQTEFDPKTEREAPTIRNPKKDLTTSERQLEISPNRSLDPGFCPGAIWLSCSTNYTLDVGFHGIYRWELKCAVEMFCGVNIHVLFHGLKHNKYFLEFMTSDNNAYHSTRDGDNLSPVCIPSPDSNSVCLHFYHTSHIDQPNYVALHPYLILDDNPHQKIDLGSLDLVLSSKHTKDDHHSQDHSTIHDFTRAIQSDAFGKYDDQPDSQKWNPSYSQSSERNVDEGYSYHDNGVNNHAGYQGNNADYHGNADKTLYYNNNVEKIASYHGNRLDAKPSDSYLHSNDVNKIHLHGSLFDHVDSKSFDIKSGDSKDGGWVPSKGFSD